MKTLEMACLSLLVYGYKNAADMPDSCFGEKRQRNREIVQRAIFDGDTAASVGRKFGISKDRARSVAGICVIRLIGRGWLEELYLMRRRA